MTNIVRPQKTTHAQRLISQILKGNTNTLPQKVAHILNQFPETRDSDRSLTIKVLEIFYPEYIIDGKILLTDLNTLPKSYDMARYRARIQNDFKLFLASPAIQALRKKNQNIKTENFITNRIDSSSVFIFSDESGKTGKFLILGSIWLYSKQMYLEMICKLNKWREKENWKSEFHFKKIKDIKRAQKAAAFFDIFIKTGYFSAFRALILENSMFSSHEKFNIVYNGLAEMLIEGIETEISTGRIAKPIILDVIKDADPESDVLQRAPLNRRVVEALDIKWKKEVVLENDEIGSADSERNDLVQIADLFTGSINRWINEGIRDKEKVPKDWLADYIGSFFDWTIDKNGLLQSNGDVCKIIYLE